MIKCKIGLHEWIYDYNYDPTQRICLICGKHQHDHFLLGWATSEIIRLHIKSETYKTFEDNDLNE